MTNKIYTDETPKIVEIKKIIKETPTVKTFLFDWDITNEKPGQFVMVWNFNDEKPMTISVIDQESNIMGVTIRKRGSFTNNMHTLKEGNLVGIRGAYGNGYSIKKGKVLVVGGGSGIASVSPFIMENIDNSNMDMKVICASSCKDELIFIDQFEKKGVDFSISTDDGSCGYNGFCTGLVEELLSNEKYDSLIACGPEIMSYKLYELAKKYNMDCQVSLERYMKCGIGICGQCCVDNEGLRACFDGPVFNMETLDSIFEFGKYCRDASGLKHEF
ncbi:MAG: dihydroorotate dehydrogenase electron transfer subunit [Methanobacteriaceae archaeon]|nr:dihydroorotate dehydrogenase electron transfer subunit [Methanobacteriaceae archaeon]